MSRNTLALIRKVGHKPVILDCVKNPPQRAALTILPQDGVPLYEVNETEPPAITPKVCRPTSSTMVLLLADASPATVPTR